MQLMAEIQYCQGLQAILVHFVKNLSNFVNKPGFFIRFQQVESPKPL